MVRKDLPAVIILVSGCGAWIPDEIEARGDSTAPLLLKYSRSNHLR